MEHLNAYKEKLLAEKTDLEQRLSEIGVQDPHNPAEWEGKQTETTPEADPNDQASQLDEYQENRAVTGVLAARYQQVLAALAHVEDGSYGTCRVCGNPIEETRLNADPVATTCVADMG